MSKPKIAWLFTDWATNTFRETNDLYGGIGYYRVIQPSRELRKWFDIEVIGSDFKHWGTSDETYTRLGRDYDLIISKHIMDGRTGSNILATAKHYKKKVIVDIDDNHLSIKKDNSAIKYYGVGEAGRYFVGAFLELADGMIVSTDPLKEAYSKLNKNIDVLPNCNTLKDWLAPIKKDDGIIKIGYAGGSAHNEDLELIIEPIARILQKYPNVTFEVIGALWPEKAREMGGKMLKYANHKILERFKITGGTEAWQDYPALLASQGWDIGLAPLTNDVFNQGKSHIKWMEYSMVGAVTIASPVHPYLYPIEGVNTIEHGKTGYFATTPDSWFEHLELLINNPVIRQQMSKNAYKFIKDNWQQKQWTNSWKQVIEKYL